LLAEMNCGARGRFPGTSAAVRAIQEMLREGSSCCRTARMRKVIKLYADVDITANELARAVYGFERVLCAGERKCTEETRGLQSAYTSA